MDFPTFITRYQDPLVWIAASFLLIAILQAASLIVSGFLTWLKRRRPW